MTTRPESKQPWAPANVQAGVPLTSENLQARLTDATQAEQAERPTAEPEATPEPMVEPKQVVVKDRLPLRPNETRTQEIGRFPGRQAAWEAADALVTAQKGNEVAHLLHLGVRASSARGWLATQVISAWRSQVGRRLSVELDADAPSAQCV